MEAKQISLNQLIVVFCMVIAVEWSMNLINFGLWYPHLLRTAITRLMEISLILGYVKFLGDGLNTIGLEPSTMRKGVTTGIIWSICFCMLALFGAAVLYAIQLDPAIYFRLSLPGTTSGILFFFITGGIISPVAEELFFRGVLFGYLRRWGLSAALAISTVIFALMHGFQGIPVTQIIGGVVFAFAYEKSKSLSAPIIIHILGNTAIFTIGAFLSQN